MIEIFTVLKNWRKYHLVDVLFAIIAALWVLFTFTVGIISIIYSIMEAY